MSHATPSKPTAGIPADTLQREKIKALACRVGGCDSFAELATVAMARQLARRGRRADVRRLVAAYLARHPETPRIARLLGELGCA